MIFDIYLPALSWVLIGVAVLAAAVALLLLEPFRRTAATPVHLPGPGANPDNNENSENNENTENSENNENSSKPSLTVIVYAAVPTDELDTYLANLMRQDYPDFNVVLVYDSGASATAAISEHYAALYKNLRFTFIPPESHNLSRPKLAVTLGMKSATGDVVLTTSAGCEIPSDSWLSEMMRPFADCTATEVVLGYSRFDPAELSGFNRLYRQFDSVRTSAMWLGYAIGGDPYRGDRYNLAFKRRLFFEQKGYSRTINLVTGDDDLFVNDIATGANTAVMLHHDTILTTRWGVAASGMWNDRKERYDFTSQWLPKGPFIRGGAVSAMQWLAFGAAVAAAVLGLPNLLAAAAGLVVLVVFWSLETLLYRRVARRLDAVPLAVAVPLFWLWHPVGNFIFRMRHRSGRKKNFTWQRRKRRHHS